MKVLNDISGLLQKNFAVFTVVIALLAYFLPDLFLWAGPYMSILMGIVMFGMSLTMEMKDFKPLLTKPKATIVGLSCVYLGSCAVTFLLVNLLNLPVGLKIGILMCAASPGGNITNVLTFIAKGDTPLSIGLTAIGTLIAPVVTPALCLLMVGAWTEVDGPGMIKTMIFSVIIPLLIGLAIKAYAKAAASKVQEFSPMISLLAISLMTGGLIAARKEALVGLDWRIIAGALGFLAGSAAMSYAIAKLFHIGEYQVRAISIEAGFKNTVLSAMLAGVSFTNYPESALACIVTALLAAVLGPVYANMLAKVPIRDNSVPQDGEAK